MISVGPRCVRQSETRQRGCAVQVATRSIPGTVPGSEAPGCPVSALKQRFTKKPKIVISSDSDERPPQPPGPAALSLQSALDVSGILRFGIHEAMLRFCNKYGDVCRFANPASLNGKSGWIFMNDPDCVEHCTATNVRKYKARYLPDIYVWITHGKGILGSQGEYNAKHRRLCQPAFRSQRLLRQFSSVITERATSIADSLVAGASRRRDTGSDLTVDVALHTQRLTLDVVGLSAFSHDFKECEQTNQELVADGEQKECVQDDFLWAVNTFGEVLAKIFITPLPVLKVLDKFGHQDLKKLSKSVDIQRERMLSIIAERRELLASGEKGPDDLLGSLLSVVDEDGSKLSDLELWEDVHDIMGAGHETTATTAAAVIYCVSVHPEVENKLMKELKDVCGTDAPTFDDLEQLPYLNQVVKEVLRLYPPIPMFPREAKENDVLPSGHRVDAGDVMFMSGFTLGRSEKLWDNPECFDPERFSPENSKNHHRFQYLPFGAGPRMCLGPSFAQMSVSLMTATLLQRLKFTAVSPTSQSIPVGYDITMNYEPTNGLHMNLEPRKAMA